MNKKDVGINKSIWNQYLFLKRLIKEILCSFLTIPLSVHTVLQKMLQRLV
ncbi:hypothetical protein IC582_025703 [Cucumis melo]